VFAKYWRALVGPTDPIVLPPNSQMVDCEAELGIVVGTPLRMVDESAALDGVAGYPIVNDISMRDWQLRTSEFLQGKTFEASTSLGPLPVTPDEVDHARRLRPTCYVDDERVQDAYTDDLIVGGSAIVSYPSQFITLTPGDIIATGTRAALALFASRRAACGTARPCGPASKVLGNNVIPAERASRRSLINADRDMTTPKSPQETPNVRRATSRNSRLLLRWNNIRDRAGLFDEGGEPPGAASSPPRGGFLASVRRTGSRLSPDVRRLTWQLGNQ
jgi:hypothetical protein